MSRRAVRGYLSSLWQSALIFPLTPFFAWWRARATPAAKSTDVFSPRRGPSASPMLTVTNTASRAWSTSKGVFDAAGQPLRERQRPLGRRAPPEDRELVAVVAGEQNPRAPGTT